MQIHGYVNYQCLKKIGGFTDTRIGQLVVFSAVISLCLCLTEAPVKVPAGEGGVTTPPLPQLNVVNPAFLSPELPAVNPDSEASPCGGIASSTEQVDRPLVDSSRSSDVRGKTVTTDAHNRN